MRSLTVLVRTELQGLKDIDHLTSFPVTNSSQHVLKSLKDIDHDHLTSFSDTNSSQHLLPISETEYHLKGLKAGTTYQISVTANYASLTNLESKDISVTTLQPFNDTADTSRYLASK